MFSQILLVYNYLNKTIVNLCKIMTYDKECSYYCGQLMLNLSYEFHLSCIIHIIDLAFHAFANLSKSSSLSLSLLHSLSLFCLLIQHPIF